MSIQHTHTERDDEWILTHWQPTPAERKVLRLRAVGDEDHTIEAALGLSPAALRSRLRRFNDRTGLVHFRLVAWCQRHRECCLGMAA